MRMPNKYDDFSQVLDAELVIDLKNGWLFESARTSPPKDYSKVQNETCKPDQNITLNLNTGEKHFDERIQAREDYEQPGKNIQVILNKPLVKAEIIKVISMDRVKCWLSNVVFETCGDSNNIDPKKLGRGPFDKNNYSGTWNHCAGRIGIRTIENDEGDNISILISVKRYSEYNKLTKMNDVRLDIDFITVLVGRGRAGGKVVFSSDVRDRDFERRFPENDWNRSKWFLGYKKNEGLNSNNDLSNIMSFESFSSFSEAYESNENCYSCNESRKKRSESKHPYFKGLSKSTIKAKKSQMKAQAEMSDDDPSAYKELPGDSRGKKKLKKSAHTSRFEKMYGK